MEGNRKLLWQIIIAVGVLLVIFLLFDSGATLDLVEKLLVYALAGVVGYYIVTAGVKLGAGTA